MATTGITAHPLLTVAGAVGLGLGVRYMLERRAASQAAVATPTGNDPTLGTLSNLATTEPLFPYQAKPTEVITPEDLRTGYVSGGMLQNAINDLRTELYGHIDEVHQQILSEVRGVDAIGVYPYQGTYEQTGSYVA